jgi:hypothetical protein
MAIEQTSKPIKASKVCVIYERFSNPEISAVAKCHEAEASLVVELFELFAAGMGAEEIAALFNKRKEPVLKREAPEVN